MDYMFASAVAYNVLVWSVVMYLKKLQTIKWSILEWDITISDPPPQNNLLKIFLKRTPQRVALRALYTQSYSYLLLPGEPESVECCIAFGCIYTVLVYM